MDLAARSARVTVPDYQLSLAIGKEGQNARLAARLTGWRIDIRPDTERTRPSGLRPAPDVGLSGTDSVPNAGLEDNSRSISAPKG